MQKISNDEKYIPDKKVKSQRRKTAKREKRKDFTSQLVRTLLEMLMTVKLYHWRTYSYAQHKATDELYENLNKNIDTFVEVFLGKDESRIEKIDESLKLYNFKKDGDFKKQVHEYRRFLQDLNKTFSTEEDSDLLTLRDELLVNINQFLYLMTFH
jgi:DNA-binding ferritin-like protein